MFIITTDDFRDSEDSISTVQTLQDYGSNVPFISQCGLSQDPSSGIMHIKSFNDGGCKYTNKCWVVGNNMLCNLMNNVNGIIIVIDMVLSY